MKLAAKLIGVTILAVLAVLGARSFQSARRQMDVAAADARENAWLTGRALRPALVEIWRVEGRERALDVLAYARERVRLVRPWDLRFISPTTGDAVDEPLIQRARLDRLWQGEEASFTEPHAGSDRLVSYIPVHVDGNLVGAIEISGLMTARDERFRSEVWQIVQRTGMAALVAALCIAVVGFLMVGRPMARLEEQARRIGAGDWSRPLHMRQRDEIGVLAQEMNEMCERLRAAHKRADEEARRRIATAEQLRHADRLSTVGKLASGVAHELGTPLNVVSGRAKMIVRHQVSGPEIEESARTIVEQSERMTRIIKQLLGFARRRQPQRARESLLAVAERTIALLHPMAAKTGVTIVCANDQAAPEVEVDAALIEHALANLVVNAIQAMPGGGEVTVRLGVADVSPPADVGGPSASFAFLRVEDQGVGMTPEHLAHSFEPFFTTKDVGEGTGLGLSVAYGIARDHGGWIAAESSVKMGSRFSIYLPMSPTRATTNADHPPPSR